MDQNKFFCTGNLSANAFINDEKTCIKFHLGVHHNSKGEQRTTWVPFVMFGPRCAKLVKHLTQGRGVTVVSHFERHEWVDEDGKECNSFVFVVESLTLHPKKDKE